MAFNSREIIDEFSFFSFLLADLHPHVLAIPFALLCLTVILHILLKTKPTKMIVAGPVHLFFTPTEFILFAIIFGAMGFLNTWDFPIYICLAASVIAFQQISSLGRISIINKVLDWILNFIVHVLILGIGGVIAYLPFDLSFSSQAGGFIVNLIYPTRGAHLWVMFGGMFLLIGLFLVYLFKKNKKYQTEYHRLKSGLLITIAFFAGIGFISFILGILAMLNPELRSFYLGSMSASNPASLLAEAVVRRWIYSLGWLTLFILLAPTLTLLLRALNREPYLPDFLGKPEVFTLFLILFGILLVITPEFIFLRDQFGWRMNTIFKFYYQAWILWAVASAIGTAVLLVEVRGRWGRIYRVGLGLVILTGLGLSRIKSPRKNQPI